MAGPQGGATPGVGQSHETPGAFRYTNHQMRLDRRAASKVHKPPDEVGQENRPWWRALSPTRWRYGRMAEKQFSG